MTITYYNFDNKITICKGKRDPATRIKCDTSECPCDHLWWHPWLIPRPARIIQNGWDSPWNQLLIHGWLCRQRLPFCRMCDSPSVLESEISWENVIIERQPWDQTDHSSVWILWWMLQEVWFPLGLDVSHWLVWLFTLGGSSVILVVLSTWWIVSFHWLSRPDQITRQSLGSASWGSHVWSIVEWSWWKSRLGCEYQRSRIHFRIRHQCLVQPQ